MTIYRFPSYSTVETALTRGGVYNGFYNGSRFKIRLIASGVFMSELYNTIITRLSLCDIMDDTKKLIDNIQKGL